MTLIPTLKCERLDEALAFYTGVLDFTAEGRWPGAGDPGYAVLSRGGDELHLSSHAGDGVAGQAVVVLVTDIDDFFDLFRSRGLDPSAKPGSPVHQGPTDQSWGVREFYVDDPAGNTLRFVQR